jgi:hypothetical protein
MTEEFVDLLLKHGKQERREVYDLEKACEND